MGTYGLICPHCKKQFNSREVFTELEEEYFKGLEEGRKENAHSAEQLEAYLQLDEARQRVFYCDQEASPK